MKSGYVSIPKGKEEGYRYIRPLLEISVFGKEGNLKTKIDNILLISSEKSLCIPPEYILKFMGYELGTQTEIKNGDYIISGKQTFDKLEEILEKFINMYILCPSKSCQKVELNYLIKGNEIRCTCTACGHKDKLDNKHKIASHIIKFPPKDKAKVIQTISTEGGQAGQSMSLDVKKIKAMIKSLDEAVQKGNEAEIKSVINEINASQSVNSPDCKYFIYLHGVYGKDIYEVFEKRVGLLKQVS